MLDELQSFGLTPIQAKVYYHLLMFGRASSIRIAKEVGVHRSEVYRVLRELAEKGVATERDEGRPIQYEAKPPKEVLQILLQEHEKKLEHLRKTLPEAVAWLDSKANIKGIKPSILLIDDDETIRKSLSHALGDEGYRVDVAENGGQALEKARGKQYAIALVDIRLPDMDGTKLLSMLKVENPQIKQIIITGYPSIENAAQAIDEGAAAYIMKPFQPSDLILKIREKLEE
jgi:CheY-like chemotaxis protein/predicted transcriptional regulator